MPRKKIFKRRPPSDARALRGATDPGIGRFILIVAGVLAVLTAGIALVVRGLF